MAAFLLFLSSPLGKLAEWAMMILFIVAVVAGIYFTVVHNAEQSQLLKDQAAIQAQVLKNQQDFANKTNQVIQLQQDTSAALKKQLDALGNSTDAINAYLNNPDTAKSDRPASDILKNTIQKLSGEK